MSGSHHWPDLDFSLLSHSSTISFVNPGRRLRGLSRAQSSTQSWSRISLISTVCLTSLLEPPPTRGFTSSCTWGTSTTWGISTSAFRFSSINDSKRTAAQQQMKYPNTLIVGRRRFSSALYLAREFLAVHG